MEKRLRDLVGDQVEFVYILHKDGRTINLDPRQDDEYRFLDLDINDVAVVVIEGKDGSISLPFVPVLANVLLNVQVPTKDVEVPDTCGIIALTVSSQTVSPEKCRKLRLDPTDPRNRCKTEGNCRYCYYIEGGARVCRKRCS